MTAQRLKRTALLLAAVVAAAPLCAQPGQRMPPGERGAPPQPRYYESAPMQPLPWQDPRTSVEERRQLRRDIHEAGREIYRPHPRRAVRADGRVPPESR